MTTTKLMQRLGALLLSPVVTFAVVGAIVGALVGQVSPGYYGYDSVAAGRIAGFGIGLAQGTTGGLILGGILVSILMFRTSECPDSKTRPSLRWCWAVGTAAIALPLGMAVGGYGGWVIGTHTATTAVDREYVSQWYTAVEAILAEHNDLTIYITGGKQLSISGTVHPDDEQQLRDSLAQAIGSAAMDQIVWNVTVDAGRNGE